MYRTWWVVNRVRKPAGSAGRTGRTDGTGRTGRVGTERDRTDAWGRLDVIRCSLLHRSVRQRSAGQPTADNPEPRQAGIQGYPTLPGSASSAPSRRQDRAFPRPWRGKVAILHYPGSWGRDGTRRDGTDGNGTGRERDGRDGSREAGCRKQEAGITGPTGLISTTLALRALTV